MPQEPQAPDQLPVVLERAYVETPTSCDSFVTRGVIRERGTLEVTSERWEAVT
jgi:hypothetical protein